MNVTRVPATVKTAGKVAEPVEAVKRLTISIPASLMERLEQYCADHGSHRSGAVQAALAAWFRVWGV
jgi:hypothetical protein